MRRFWKGKDEVRPFHAPPSARSPSASANPSLKCTPHAFPDCIFVTPCARSSSAPRNALFVGDNAHHPALHAAAGGGGWTGREIDGR